jgi:small-conductance mechanosensitive channel
MRAAFDHLAADPELGSLLLGAYEDLGLDAYSDLGQILKARVKTLPGKQWRVRRAFNERIRTEFAAAGLKLAWDKEAAPS